MTGPDLLRTLPCDGSDGPSGPTLAAGLHAAGLVRRGGALAHHPADPGALLALLRDTGAASLSAGRILEGHVNAIKLLVLHGGPVAPDLLSGVWGADGPDPVRIEGDVLRGQKLYASGADVLDRVIVTARTDRGVRLVLLTRDALAGRLHPGEWRMSGMRATASGRCDLDGVPLAHAVLLGAPGAYLVEPHFHGGVWRYGAVQLGAMRELTRIAARQLRDSGRIAAPLQAMRLHRMIAACETAEMWLTRAAHEVEHPDAPPAAAETAILARLRTAEEAATVMAEADRALGAGSHATGHPADRIRRDLGLYLRQADPDGLALAQVARIADTADLNRRWIG